MVFCRFPVILSIHGVLRIQSRYRQRLYRVEAEQLGKLAFQYTGGGLACTAGAANFNILPVARPVADRAILRPGSPCTAGLSLPVRALKHSDRSH